MPSANPAENAESNELLNACVNACVPYATANDNAAFCKICSRSLPCTPCAVAEAKAEPIGPPAMPPAIPARVSHPTVLLTNLSNSASAPPMPRVSAMPPKILFNEPPRNRPPLLAASASALFCAT